MTYCVGMMLDAGLVFMSDTRTNAGVDNISTFKKMACWEQEGDRSLTLLSSGNLGTTQAAVSLLDERLKTVIADRPSLMNATSMFQAAQIVAETLREVMLKHSEGPAQSTGNFGATLIFGGQISGGPPRLFMIYPAGNFIEASSDTPFFQIGETKYGRPILVRAYDREMSFSDAMRLLTVSFDSTVKANLSVAAPFDFHIYAKDSFKTGLNGRIEAGDAYVETVATQWGDALKSALDSLPSFELHDYIEKQ